MRSTGAALSAVVVVLLGACDSGPDAGSVVDAMAVGVAAGQADAVDGLLRLQESAGAACSGTGALADAQDAFALARSAWKRLDAVAFGPATTLRVESTVDWGETDGAAIDDRLADPEAAVDVDYVRLLAPATQRGFGAVEHVLFGPAPIAARGCALLEALLEVMVDDARTLAAAWSDGLDGAPSYRTVLAEMPDRDALGLFVTGLTDLSSRLSLFGLGRVLGITTPDPDPEAMPEGAARGVLSDVGSQLDGVRSVYMSGGEFSMRALVGARSEGAASGVMEALERASEALDDLPASIEEALLDDRDGLVELYEAIGELRRVLETEVAAALGVTIGFGDTDGDA